MSSVTARIKMVKQPRGGYLKVSSMSKLCFDDGLTLSYNENIHSSIVGMTVDYLTRYFMGSALCDAFRTSLLGARSANIRGQNGALAEACKYLGGITGDDAQSIINACKLTSFDVWFRAPSNAEKYRIAKEINPDSDTIRNIQIMVDRCLDFWDSHGPIVEDGFSFYPCGYTSLVSVGDGDYLTKDTIWDLKVLKTAPKSKHTLQLLMYWIMGQHSKNPEFKEVSTIGIFNPRFNIAYTYDMTHYPPDLIQEVEHKIIGYT